MLKTEKQKEANRIWMKEWAKNNPAKVLERRERQYLRVRRDKILWDKELERQKILRLKNKESNIISRRNYRIKNLEKIRAYYRDYRKKDTVGQIAARLYSRINGALKVSNAEKHHKTIELVGCPVSVLKKHLEARFKIGMSWKDKKRFHIDHIIPLSRFDLTDPAQQKKAFHYTNLQPLWAFENLSKGSKLTQ